MERTLPTIPQYKSVMDKGIPGQPLGMYPSFTTIRRCETELAFGVAVFAALGQETLVTTTPGTDTFKGFTVREFNEEGFYPTKYPISCMEKGLMYVKVTGTVQAGGVVAIKADGSIGAAGTTDYINVNAKFTENGTDGAIVAIEIG